MPRIPGVDYSAQFGVAIDGERFLLAFEDWKR